MVGIWKYLAQGTACFATTGRGRKMGIHDPDVHQ